MGIGAAAIRKSIAISPSAPSSNTPAAVSLNPNAEATRRNDPPSGAVSENWPCPFDTPEVTESPASVIMMTRPREIG